MFRLETLNELTLKATCMDGRGALFTKAGAMIGYRGNCKFEKVLLGPQGNPLGALMGSIGRRLTGENMPLMKVETNGQSESYYANLAQHVTVINLREGMSISVESENLLAFTDSCKYGFKFLAQGVISQKGMFTSTLTATGPNAQVAIISEGNPLVLDTPCFVDPDAHVANTGPDPSFKLGLSWKNIIGQASGESYMFEFKQPGHKVIVQPSERRSGLDIGIDGGGGRPDVQQNNLFGGGSSNNQSGGGLFGNLFN